MVETKLRTSYAFRLIKNKNLARLSNFFGKRIRFMQIIGNLVELENNLSMSQNEIFEYQTTKLRKLIQHAYTTVPFYRHLFDKYKIDPDDIQTVADLTKVPVIDKSVLRKFPVKNRISTAVSKQSLKQLYTGGSTGQPFSIYVTGEELDMIVAHKWRFYFEHGCNFFDKEALVEGIHGTVRKGWLNRLGLARRVEVPHGLLIQDQLKVILNERSDVYRGYPSRLHLIAKYAEENHIDIKQPKAIFSDSETLLPYMRNSIEKAFRVKVTNIYDSFEFGYTAWECREHSGLHINCDSQIVQIMKNDIEVEDGNRGEIVVTNLDGYAMPLIRYNTKDVGRKLKGKCVCGIDFPMLATVEGREWDFLFSPSGEKISPLVITGFIAIQKGVIEYRVTQKKKEEIDIEIVVSKNYNYNTDSLIKRYFENQYHFKEIKISHPQSLKKTPSGKFRSVIREF
jgi:phenylacetate-CoA ligase